MPKKLKNIQGPVFEQIKHIDENGKEYWGARQLAKVLEYSDFRNFLMVVSKAREACKNSKENVEDHVVDFNEMIQMGKGANRMMSSVKLSRYACYLVVQNADPGKDVVALGQTYFAVQTRLREIQELDSYQDLNSEDEKRLFLRQELYQHNKYLASTAKGAGVIDPIDYAIFQNFGYKGLYGGLDAKGIHKNKSLKKSQNILDHMGSIELAANLFRTTQAEDKLRRENIKGKEEANTTHFEVGQKVRKTIKELGGTMPEDLPTVDSIKQLNKKKEIKTKL